MNTPITRLTLPATPQDARERWGTDAGVAHQHDYRRVYLCDCGAEKPLLGRPLATARHAAWKARFDAGDEIEVIARDAGVTRAHLRRAIKRLGAVFPDGRANRPRFSADPERDETIRRLAVDDHLTYSEIGLRLGITRERVRQVLAYRFGIDTHALTLASNEARRAARPPVIVTCRFCGEGYVQGTYPAHREAAGAGHKRPDATADRGARIVADYQAGMRVVDIMSKYGVAASRIMRDLRYAGVSSRQPRAALPTRAESRARKDAIAAAIVTGQRRIDIARHFGVSDSWVHMIAKERGLRIGVPA